MDDVIDVDGRGTKRVAYPLAQGVIRIDWQDTASFADGANKTVSLVLAGDERELRFTASHRSQSLADIVDAGNQHGTLAD